MIQLVDTHCHIHFPDYELELENVIRNAQAAGVSRLLLVGCTLDDSRTAVSMVLNRQNMWAAVGLHPHESAVYVNDDQALQQFRVLAVKSKVVAIGETGLDYHYMHSPQVDQRKLFRFQLDLASEHNLPVIFHVREAFDDFWKIVDEYPKLKGVVHSFSASPKELSQILERGFYVGLNGIMTFTKVQEQLEAAKQVPLDRLLLETDSPFLTPVPFRGKIGEPKYVRTIAEFLADLRQESLENLAEQTTKNAITLFGL